MSMPVELNERSTATRRVALIVNLLQGEPSVADAALWLDSAASHFWICPTVRWHSLVGTPENWEGAH